ncbi:trigger factor [Candidatus Poribacteria bacterium]|nr:trigger factor [Candidatus Poribacteria bacterium]
MKVNVETVSTYQKVLTIEIPSETVNAEIENIYSTLSKTAIHPGFRKGKVPRKILEKKYNKSVRNEAIENTVTSSLKSALADQKIVPLVEPSIDEVKFDDGAPLSFKVTIEVEPTIELAEYKGIELKRPKIPITDEGVNRVVERLRLSHATYIPVERAVEKGDFIVIDFAGSEGGKPVEGLKAENFPVEVGAGVFAGGFEDQLIGMQKNEARDVSVKYPEDFRTKELAGKDVTYHVTLKDVKLRRLPDVDDAFAKDLGEYNTLEDLKKNVREGLEKDMQRRIEHLMREQGISKVVSESKLEIPPKLKARVAASIFEEQVRSLASRGVDRETITVQRDKIAEQAAVDAERQLKARFVADEIARRENITVTTEELNQRLEEMIASSEDQTQARTYFNSERVRESSRDQMLAQKILDFVVNNARIIEVESPQSGSELQPEPDEQEGES